MTDKPLVSIIIPTYNRPQRVKEAIGSALDQNYSDVEVIVVDDNSDYDLERIRIDDDRVQYV
jgi:glycosyltransferase involved in cell wall biosynthesis